MQKLKKNLHYLFGKHKWKYCGKQYKGNEETGHIESAYIFKCAYCDREKIIKVN